MSTHDARAWWERGRAHVGQGRFDEAARCFASAVELDPRFADGWHDLGTALRRLDRQEQAFDALKRALLIEPARADSLMNLGNLLIDSGQLDDALECYERAARHDPAVAHTQIRLAGLLAARGRLRRAGTLYRRAMMLDPREVEGWIGLGRAMEDVGDAGTAMTCYRNALVHAPGHATALGLYLALLRAPAPEGLLAATATALEDPSRSDEARALIGYGLARYHDRRGEHAGAAAAGEAANVARRRAAGPFDRDAFDARIGEITRASSREFFSGRKHFGLGNDQPVFIVGLPRSGTTLTEQIVASHPLMHGAGELPDLARLAARASPGAPWSAAGEIDADGSRRLAGDYLHALRDDAPAGRLRITDKSPFNFLQLGLAALLFPQARVIHCRRDPRDTALSIWFENFDPGQQYATSFADIAHLRRGHERLMAHWQEALPLPILTVDYESLVADVEGQARRIVAFLGVPWDRRCLDFHRSERPVQTPSRWQVRQPVYSRSVGRWRAYDAHLPELAAAFG